MILREIICARQGCGRGYKELHPNEGFPGWGHVGGVFNPDTGEDCAHLCPECRARVMAWLNGELLDMEE